MNWEGSEMDRALGSRYHLSDPLGSGAMGQVFAGTDTEGREYAFKILRSDLTGNPDVVNRFLQERSILVGLRQPNLVTVHDLVAEGETVAIVMDLVRGGDLRRRLEVNGPLLPAEVARIGAGIASALAAVHEAGVVHRDVKPENVLMDESVPRLTDFGISRIARSSEVGRSSLLAGTPQYVAPELADGDEPAPAADLYSLGIVLYELSCGVTPFAGGSMLQVIRQHAEHEPGRPEGVPDALWEMISWLLAKGPKSRPQSALQVATLLEGMTTELAMAPAALKLDKPPLAKPMQFGAPTQTAFSAPPPAVAGPPMSFPPAAPPPRRRRAKVVLTFLAVVVVLVGALIGWNTIGTGSTGGSADPGPSAGPSSSRRSTVAPTTTESAAPTVAPNLVGKKLAEAQDMFPANYDIQIVNSVEQTAQPGTVIAQDPEPGVTLDGHIQLTVAQDPVEVYLDELKPVSSNTFTEGSPGSVAGKTYPHTLRSAISCYQTSPVEYNISKGFRQLNLTAGIDDDSTDSSMRIQLEIFGDGRKLASPVLEFGKAAPVDIDVSGVLRLKFSWEVIGGENSSCTSDYIDFGSAKLLGLPGEVPSATPTS
jgi:hypothetical protein